jgi:hypothetical protein
MTRYLISFDDSAMTFPGAEPPDVAGLRTRWPGGQGRRRVGVRRRLKDYEEARVVATDRTVTDSPYARTTEARGE